MKKEHNSDAINEPKWYKMHTSKGMPSSGEILASFAIVEKNTRVDVHIRRISKTN